MTKTLGLATLLSTITAAGFTYAAVPNNFSDGEPAVAAEVNENFTNLDTRVTTLENNASNNNAATTITVDCNNGGSVNNAISDATPSNHLLVNVLGTCNERIVITRSNTTLRGEATGGTTVNFVETPLSPLHASVNANEFAGLKGAINVIGANNVVIDSLNITGATDTGTTIGASGKGVAVRFNGSALIQNSTITGNYYGISSNSGGVAILSNNNINTNTRYGIIATDAGVIRLIGDNIITQTGPQGDSDNAAVGAFRNGTVTFLGANTLNASPSSDNVAISAFYGSQIRSHFGLLTVNGNSAVGYDAHINFRDVNHIGDISIFSKGTVRLQDRASQTISGVSVTGNISVGTLGLFDSRTGTTVNGNITCNGNSSYATAFGITNGTITGC